MDRGNENKYGSPTAPERPAAEDDPDDDNDDDDDDKKPAHDPDYVALDYDTHMDDEIRELPPPHPEPVLFEPLILIPITHQPLVTELYDGPALFTTPILPTDTLPPYIQYPMNDTIITQEDIENDNRELQVLIQWEANRKVFELDPDPDADTLIPRDTHMIAEGWGNQFSGQPQQWKCNACSVFNEMTLTHCAACKTPKNSDDGNTESTAATTTTSGVPQWSSGTTAATTTSIQSSTSLSSNGFVFVAAPSTGGTSATITTHVAAAAAAPPPPPTSTSGFVFAQDSSTQPPAPPPAVQEAAAPTAALLEERKASDDGVAADSHDEMIAEATAAAIEAAAVGAADIAVANEAALAAASAATLIDAADVPMTVPGDDEKIVEATAAAIEAAAVGAADMSVTNEAALAAASAATLMDAADVPMTVPDDDEIEGPNGKKNEQRRKRNREKSFDDIEAEFPDNGDDISITSSQKKKKPRFKY
jgi:hypothetical protein